MSRNRLIAKIRKNDDFAAVTAHLDDQGYAWRLLPMGRQKHPRLEIAVARGTVTYSVTCTPRAVHIGGSVARLRRFLAAVGG